MCHKLLQVYHCGCTKEICTTPCPHALTTATSTGTTSHRAPVPGRPPYPVSRSNSGSNTPQSVVQMARSGSTTSTKTNAASITHTNATTSLKDRDVLPSRELISRLSLSETPVRPFSAFSSHTPTPLSAAAELPTPTLTAQSQPDDDEPTPNLCAYFFKRHTPVSIRPCWACYLKPEYEAQRERWMADYKAAHFGARTEDLERLAGIEAIRKRVAEL